MFSYLFVYMVIRFVRANVFHVNFEEITSRAYKENQTDERMIYYPKYYLVTGDYYVDDFLHFVERLLKLFLWQVPIF